MSDIRWMLASVLATILPLWACATPRVLRATVPDLAWPAFSPRLRLVQILDLGKGGGALAGLIGGRQAEPLFTRPYGVSWYGRDLVVTDPTAHRVLLITEGGRVESSQLSVGVTPMGVAECAQGPIVTDATGGQVLQLTRDLRLARVLATGLARPTGVACDMGSVFVTETGAHRITVIDRDGLQRRFGSRGSGPAEFNFPTAIAVRAGELWVGDTLNFRVQRLSANDGSFRSQFGRLGDSAGEMPRLKGLAIDPEGNCWVSDAHLDRLSVYDRDGALLMSIGGLGGEPGRFDFPAGVAVRADGRLAVADALNRRVQVLQILPPVP